MAKQPDVDRAVFDKYGIDFDKIIAEYQPYTITNPKMNDIIIIDLTMPDVAEFIGVVSTKHSLANGKINVKIAPYDLHKKPLERTNMAFETKHIWH